MRRETEQSVDHRARERTERRQGEPIILDVDDREYPARVIDESVTSIALQTAIRPPIGARVWVERRAGWVVRYLSGGIAIQFDGQA
jgi:hypothetical protein